MIFGAAAQFGIFFTLLHGGCSSALICSDAASIAIIGAADGPTSIFVANYLQSKYLGAIIVAAYSYMALVPIVQPPVIKLLTSQKGAAAFACPTRRRPVSKTTKILFPIIVTVVAGDHRAPQSRGADRLSDVRQSDPRVRRAGGASPRRRRRRWPIWSRSFLGITMAVQDAGRRVPVRGRR